MTKIKAKKIKGCSNCPLLGNDCPGGHTSDGGGSPVEPPCCTWDDDTLVYPGMYDED